MNSNDICGPSCEFGQESNPHVPTNYSCPSGLAKSNYITNPDKCVNYGDFPCCIDRMPVCVKPVNPIPSDSFEKIANDNSWGCLSTEPDFTDQVNNIRAYSLSREEIEVQTYCYNNPNCKG